MTTREILEVIKVTGETFFCEIDPNREVINIGSHSENDIVITGPGIAPYHAMLDLRLKPYQFKQLSETGETKVGETILSPSASREMHPWDTIEVGDYRITLIEWEKVEKRPPPESTIMQMPDEGTSRSLARRSETALMPPSGLAVRPPDQVDDAIVTKPVVPEYTIDAGQTLTLVFSISNGGETVADFDVSLEGLDPNWVTITPARVHLLVNQLASVTVSITPPRDPTSRAGQYHFAVMVTSPNYPGRMSRRGATLIINPFYEFTIGEITPRQLTISWKHRTATTTLTVINQSNSLAHYRTEGSDDDHACSFEFQLPGENVRLANQADFHLASDTTVVLPVFISARKHQLVGLRNRDVPFTISATPLEGTQPPRTVMGRLSVRPLIGPWLSLLILVAFFALAVFGFWPRMSLNVSPTEIRSGQPVEIKWTSWPPILMTLKLNGEQLGDTRGELTQQPLATTRYQLTADTWASRLFSNNPITIDRTVNVTPVTPEIRRFQAQPPQVNSGEYTEISWSVTDADRLVLVSENVSQTLDSLEGSQKIRVEKQTVFTIKAYNNSLPGKVIEQELSVAVSPPPGKPAPVILDFRVEPSTITEGQDVIISWQVSGVEEVSIQPLGDQLPPSGSVTHTPTETMLYVLAASNGQISTHALRQITVNPIPPTPTPTPAPLAPKIELFTVSPSQPIQVSNEEVEVRLDWVVSGRTTNIVLTGGPLDRDGVSQLRSEDSFTFFLTEDAIFVLKAFNGDQQAIRTVEVRLQESPNRVLPSAYNLFGQLEGNPNPPPDNGTLLTWDYDAENQIIGFRVYRNSGSGFTVIAAEDRLNSSDREYFDPSDDPCMSYYVVAVYLNASGQWRETAPSDQWQTSCP
ncbi:MAG: FHA domain-containing protein [Anaerolineales bacterium]|nr:MAG: FHA domain-containing protein [Anaerolineales bacterium]